MPSVDFLFGGSVLDNIFDPATYMVNVSKLLRPGGRVFDQNIISQVHHPYLLVTPHGFWITMLSTGSRTCRPISSSRLPPDLSIYMGYYPPPMKSSATSVRHAEVCRLESS